MTGSYTNNGDGTATINFEYTGDLQKSANVIDRAAFQLWLQGQGNQGVEWADITNQEKLDLVDQFVKERIRNLSRAQLANDYNQTAQNDFEADWDSNYDLGLGE